MKTDQGLQRPGSETERELTGQLYRPEMFYKQKEFNRSRNSEPEGTERTLIHLGLSEIHVWEDFTGGPVVKNLPFNARDSGSIPNGGTKILYASEQLIPWATVQKMPRDTMKIPHAATKT